jgi:hypothetical protein
MERMCHRQMPQTSMTPLIRYSLEMHLGRYTKYIIKVCPSQNSVKMDDGDV